MTAKTYLIRILNLTLIAVILVVGLNFIVDPYRITGISRISGVNEYKVDINNHVRLMKKYNPLSAQHNTLILGNSRVEMGVNPAHHCFQEAGLKAYNLGMPGAPVQTQLAYALNLVYQQPIHTVFLSLDFIDFIWTKNRDRFDGPALLDYAVDGFRFTASGEPNPEYFWTLSLDYFRSLFSLDALISSVKTLALQDSAAPDRDDAGFNPARDFEEIVRVEGTRALFDQKIPELEEHFSAHWYVRDDEGRLDPSFDDLEAFLDIAVEKQIQVYLFVNPFHESYWKLLRAKGLMHLHVEWKKALEALVRQYAEQPVRLWDFSGESSFIQEPLPAAGQKLGPLQWFWEPSFYRQQLGDLMIEAVLSDKCDTETALGHRVQ
jgi:hypothetical protein